jgi:hypothetical protein
MNGDTIRVEEGLDGSELFVASLVIDVEGRRLCADHAVIDTGLSLPLLIPQSSVGATPADARPQYIETMGGRTRIWLFEAVVQLGARPDDARRVEVGLMPVDGAPGRTKWFVGLPLLRDWVLDLRRQSPANPAGPSLFRPSEPPPARSTPP